MTPLARFDHYRSRIGRFNPGLNAFLHLRLAEAAVEAAEADARAAAGSALSPVDGWCIAVKANIAVAGLPHHAGIGAYRGDIAGEDAEVVRRLRSAGAVILGTVNMHEGALGATTDNAVFGRTANPWSLEHTPGGSSGGSAAAVAAGLCDGALGSDTMGSVRIPSAYCGVQGHKPSPGRVPDAGVLALSPTLDHVGPHARSVAGLRDMMSALAAAPMASPPAGLAGLRVGVWRAAGQIELTPEVERGLQDACAALRSAGVLLGEAEPPAYAYGRSRRAGLLICEVEAGRIHAQRLGEDPAGFSDSFRRLLAWGAARPAAELEAAYAHVDAVRAAAPAAFADCDLVLAPTAPQQAFRFTDPAPANQADFTAWADFAALPATAIGTGVSASTGLPLGVQLIGRRGEDGAVLSAALAAEALFGRPPAPPSYT
jgi:aspartyl-tRNA(Asn)/glutamyl-tRNA(Gln) amidotransferase subunit A